jgi:hypothetical protein
MQIRMNRQRVLLDAGRERLLALGRTYDVADVVARQLIACGDAVEVRDDAPTTTDRKGKR